MKTNLAQVWQSSVPESKGLLRKARAFDHAMIGMALLDMDGRWIDVNTRFCQMLGYRRSSMLSRSYESLTFEDDLEISRSWMTRLRSGDIDSCEFEKRYRGSDGRIVWTQVHAVVVRPEPQEAPFIICQTLDISDQKTTRDALQESEALLRVAVDGADLGMWHWNIESGQFIFNERAHHLLGYQEGDVESRLRSIMGLVHPDDRKQLSELVIPHLKGQRPGLDQVLRFRRKDERYMWLLLRGQVTRRDGHGWALQVSGTIMDVSKWKELERRLTRMATVDELTGLLNRRSGMSALSLAIQSSERSREPMSLVLLDIDHFKYINDSLGHQVGDEVLKALGTFLKSNLRGGDHAVRLGGEEFAIILPGTDRRGAVAQAERLFNAIGQVADAVEGVHRMTVSMGVVTRREDELADSLLKRADALMYRAKSAGRNNIKTD